MPIETSVNHQVSGNLKPQNTDATWNNVNHSINNSAQLVSKETPISLHIGWAVLLVAFFSPSNLLINCTTLLGVVQWTPKAQLKRQKMIVRNVTWKLGESQKKCPQNLQQCTELRWPFRGPDGLLLARCCFWRSVVNLLVLFPKIWIYRAKPPIICLYNYYPASGVAWRWLCEFWTIFSATSPS